MTECLALIAPQHKLPRYERCLDFSLTEVYKSSKAALLCLLPRLLRVIESDDQLTIVDTARE
jgi:hypothetical protein